MVEMHDRLIPDVSLGTHFFNDIVEHDMLYLAYFPRNSGNSFDTAWFRSAPNRLLELEPDATKFADIVRVIDCADIPGRLWLRADATQQESIVFRTD